MRINCSTCGHSTEITSSFCPSCGKRILISSKSCQTVTFNPSSPGYDMSEVDDFLVGLNNTLLHYENDVKELLDKMEVLVDEIERLRQINARYEREIVGSKGNSRSCAEESDNSVEQHSNQRPSFWVCQMCETKNDISDCCCRGCGKAKRQ